MSLRRVWAGALAIAFGTGLMAVASTGVAAEKSEAEMKYDEQVDKCQQMTNQDEKQDCLDEAMKEYQAAKEKSE